MITEYSDLFPDVPTKTRTEYPDVGIGAVLNQLCSDDIEYPILFYSKKLNKHQRNYSTIEKECFSLVSALHHYDVYVNVTRHPVLVYTDHHPLENETKKSEDFVVEFVNSELSRYQTY